MGPVKENTDILFDRVITNIGGSYDVSDGRFTAPVNGTYQFSVAMAAQGRQKVYALTDVQSKACRPYSCKGIGPISTT